jgi:predicted metal-dependent enzyme (double-stranded beta helix superfamily)
MFLFCRGEMPSSISPPPGELTTVVVVVLRGEEYHVVAEVAGHELETPEAEHRPGLKRLPKIVHLELNMKVFVNTQQDPYLARQLSVFRTREDPQPTSEFVAVCPRLDGLMQDGTQEGG